jgi:hypothetical protein
MAEEPKNSNLPLKLSVDVFSGCFSAVFLSPFITTVDKSIIKNANGSEPLRTGLRNGFRDIFTRPWVYFKRREFYAIWFLYSATYSTANCVNSISIASDVDPKLPTFIATTAVNMPVCVIKDQYFTKWFGVVAAKKVPWPSMGLFAARDCLTVASSFTWVPILSKKLHESTSFSQTASLNMAQLFLPMGVQLVSTPMHLLGLDLYNHPHASTNHRVVRIRQEYWKSAFARQLRIGFAFGVGGIGNRMVRDKSTAFFALR